ncbi:MAG: chemotaxis protein CheW [Desulfohalobiaceae bacterium]
MDDETLQMYVQESREHLSDIENDLLEIEQQGANADLELVNKVFRAAHSIKGGAGFLGLQNIKELAHKIENVLDLVRNQELVPSSEVVNIVLLAFDRLNELVENAQGSNQEDVQDHIQALQNIVAGELPQEQKQGLEQKVPVQDSQGRTVFEISQVDIEQAQRGGRYLYLVEYDLIHDVQRKEKTPMQVIKNMSDSGEIVDLKMDLAAVGTLEQEELASNLPMFVLFSSIIEPDLVDKLLDLEQSKVLKVELEPSAGPEPEQPAEPASEPSAAEVSSERSKPKEAGPQEPKQPAVEPKTDKAQAGTAASRSREQKSQQTKPSQKDQQDKAAQKDQQDKSKSAAQADSLRVNVNVLDQLMNLAGELVLSRNQLLQSIHQDDKRNIQAAGQRIDLVTSELQEAIMLTRMQAVGNIFNKFPRVVRDMARDMNKKMELELQGKEVELDKAIIEGLGDPLTHLVRNSADHGIESPEQRLQKGKPEAGHILLKAYHESGQVNIEIQDDGKGMDPDKIADKAVQKGLISQEKVQTMSDKEKVNLIMLPGLSTTEQISDVSGRGVGMDVVKSNLDKLGGQVDIDSTLDQGSTIRIKLPLTLAIIPSLLVSVAEDRFAVAQVNVSELLRVTPGQARERVEQVGDAEVLVLRGELIPLLHLDQLLGLQKYFLDPQTGKKKPDRRQGLADKRLQETDEEKARKIPERRNQEAGVMNIVVVQAGPYKYGLVVDQLHDSVEIVVKPLGRHLKNCEAYAGATIMGDGKVALILDVPGLARIAELSSMAGTERATEIKAEKQLSQEQQSSRHSLLLFRNAPEEHCAVSLNLVQRVEQISPEQIEVVGGKKVIQYRGGNLPVFALEEVANVGQIEDSEELIVLVFQLQGREIGLLAAKPVDALETDILLDEKTLRQPGISGSAIIKEKTTLLVNIYEVLQSLERSSGVDLEICTAEKGQGNSTPDTGQSKVLLVEDSDFFRSQVSNVIQDAGFEVLAAEDGQVAWELLQDNPEIKVVVTDLEMPNMDGFELTRYIRQDQTLAQLPVIALTSLAAEEDRAKGQEAGIDDYQIKMDKERLLASIKSYLEQIQA